MVLRAGALPVSLDFLEQRIVGPTLGFDSIYKTGRATLYGFLIILIFALIYYRVAGLISIVTLALNVLFTLAVLMAFGATLTLPGIAGIALTIGMAIDSNIIIYERIREEIRRGVSNYQAAEHGFNFSFLTIIDANISTAMAGVCLLNFGTGPVRGFAVTLIIGIFSTVYTAYYVSRVLFDLYLYRSKGRQLSI
jgi:protein-export membrane protein SecD